ncbi:hypothetical protein BvCmsNSNP012_01331 [Escherichia coli]|nr:hypothetical protein BvCmsNSNP012_01331 [Escherichia coli]
MSVNGTLQMLGSPRQQQGGGNAASAPQEGWGQPPQNAQQSTGKIGQASSGSGGMPPMDFDDDIPFMGRGYGVERRIIHVI